MNATVASAYMIGAIVFVVCANPTSSIKVNVSIKYPS